jgi:hypothetical protein
MTDAAYRRVWLEAWSREAPIDDELDVRLVFALLALLLSHAAE